MYHDVPKKSRYEIKFICYEHNYFSLLNWIKINQLNFKQEYPSRYVNNIYFDSIDNKFYTDNIYGISSRLKIRYRWYGPLNQCDIGKLEFKFKRNLFGWKKDFLINSKLINENLNWKSINSIISNELSGFYSGLFQNNSKPQIINSYKRDYFISFNKKIRITLDKKHKIFDQRIFDSPNFKKRKIRNDYLVIEFKFNRKDLRYYKQLLNKFLPIQISKNSKYINGIRAVMGI